MSNPELIPTQELEVYKDQVAKAEKFSTSLEIKNENDYHSAVIEAKGIKDRLEMVEARRSAILKPLKASVKAVNELFDTISTPAENAIAAIKAKLKSYYDAKEAKAAVKIDKIVDRYDQGKIGEGEANAKIMLATPDKTVVTESGKATANKLKKYVVVDKTLIPLHYMEPDMVKIRASFKAGIPVPGIEERLETNISLG